MNAAPPEPSDAASREAARLELGRNVLVEAGAGTGKTSLLTDRALAAILGAGVPAAEVVALTFTEKAASEIQVRLGGRLFELAAFLSGEALPEEARGRCEAFLGRLRGGFGVAAAAAAERARAALENLDRAPIGTLHQFASRILRAYPLEAGMDPAFRVDEGAAFEELFALEWPRWLEAELADGSPREARWVELLELVGIRELEELARELCGPRRDLDRLFDPPAGMKEWIRESVAVLRAEPARQPPSRGGAGRTLAEAADRLERLLNIPTPSPGGRASVPSEGDLSSHGEPFPDALPEPERIEVRWPSGWDERERERCLLAARLAGRSSPQREAVCRRAAELLLPFAAAFRRAYSWRGWTSFDGLLVAARDLVRGDLRVREELKRRYRTFLVDEFQDTDPLQGELLLYLAERPGEAAASWEETRLEPGKLFVVGDPKQSIYRFRGADLAAYEGFKRHLLRQEPPALCVALESSFRSHEGLLSPVNGLFGRLMSYSEGLQPAYAPILPARSAGPGEGVRLAVIEPPPGGAAGVEELRRTEAEWITAWIEGNCADAGTDSMGKYRFKDVAILLRTTTPLGLYLDALKERGIPYVVEAEKYFYGTQEAVDFLNLLRALDDPSDRTALAGLLRSPLVGVPDAELVRLAPDSLDCRRDVRVRVPSAPRINVFYRVLRELSRGVGRRPLSGLVPEAAERTRLLELLPAAYHGQQTLSNLLKFVRMAVEANDASGTTLRDFVRRVARSMAESEDEGESPLADEQLDAVRLSTVHKAKGLEYPVVIVPNLSGGTQGGRAGASLPAGGALADAYLRMRERRREEAEQLRLLYVACTRAKERLILLGGRDPARGSLGSWLALAGVWPRGGPGIEAEAVPAGARPLRPARRARPDPGESAAPSVRLERLRRERAARCAGLQASPRFVSPSSLIRVAGEEAEGDRSDPPPTEPTPSPRGRAPGIRPPRGGANFQLGGLSGSPAEEAELVGRVCHKVLERWDFRRGGDLGRETAAACRLLGRESPGRAWDRVREECRGILGSFLESGAGRELARAEILGRELPFAYGEGGQVVRGALDLLYRSGSGLWVADYKTAAVPPRELTRRARAYLPQGRCYRRAVELGLGVAGVGFSVIFLRGRRAVPVIEAR